jgi:succinyl-CoA synthetase alpha subunit
VLPLTSIALGVEADPGADLALISVPGDYAAAEAMKALALGLHVMMFSDNVSIAEERAIKTAARARNLLVMGPDCGTGDRQRHPARLRQRRAARRHRPRRGVGDGLAGR